MMFIYMPLIVAAWYGTGEANRQVFFGEVFQVPALVAATNRPAPLIAFDTVVTDAQRRWHVTPIASLELQYPNDLHARIVVRSDTAAGPLRAADLLVYDGVSGAFLAEQSARNSNAKAFRDVMLGLHQGLFASPILRALYVLSGLLGAAMIATGLVLWAVKCRQRIEMAGEAPHLGLRLVEKLNVATIFGLPVAIAAYFWANRLLPLDLANRADWEVHSLFLVWLAMFLHASIRPAPRVWADQSGLAGASRGWFGSAWSVSLRSPSHSHSPICRRACRTGQVSAYPDDAARTRRRHAGRACHPLGSVRMDHHLGLGKHRMVFETDLTATSP